MDILDDYPSETELRALHFIDSGHGWATGVSGLTLKTQFPVNIEATYKDSDFSTFPNPFTTSTSITYTIDRPSNVVITIFNSQGNQVDIMNLNQPKGQQHVQWNAERLPAGMYYFRFIDDKGRICSGRLLKY